MSNPIKVLRGGSLEFVDGRILIKNWSLNMGGRTGDLKIHNFEILIAVRDYMNAEFDVALMMQDDDQYGKARMVQARVSQILEVPQASPVPKKRHPWWRFW